MRNYFGNDPEDVYKRQIVNRLLKRVRDFAEVRGNGIVTKQTADMALEALEIDRLGLDSIDRRMLESIIKNFNGGPVGLDTLAATIGEEPVTLEDVYAVSYTHLDVYKRQPPLLRSDLPAPRKDEAARVQSKGAIWGRYHHDVLRRQKRPACQRRFRSNPSGDDAGCRPHRHTAFP